MQLLHSSAVALLCFAHPFSRTLLSPLPAQLTCTLSVLFCLLCKWIQLRGFDYFGYGHCVILHSYLAQHADGDRTHARALLACIVESAATA